MLRKIILFVVFVFGCKVQAQLVGTTYTENITATIAAVAEKAAEAAIASRRVNEVKSAADTVARDRRSKPSDKLAVAKTLATAKSRAKRADRERTAAESNAVRVITAILNRISTQLVSSIGTENITATIASVAEKAAEAAIAYKIADEAEVAYKKARSYQPRLKSYDEKTQTYARVKAAIERLATARSFARRATATAVATERNAVTAITTTIARYQSRNR